MPVERPGSAPPGRSRLAPAASCQPSAASRQRLADGRGL